ncbi:MAG: hypothetical protein EPN22_15200 [Nitrospirae bacterium]|nr:MAG: hypothetical protein EPN22_15200 [Nitrospirota bacterium]
MGKLFDSGQLSIHFGHDEASLRRHFEKGLDRHVSLVLTENSTNMLSAKVINGVMNVRLQRMFLDAGNDVIAEIVLFLKNKKSSMPNFRNFIRENREHIRRKCPKTVSINTAGRHHDLRPLFDRINAEYFGGMIKARITWGIKSSRRTCRKRTLGSYTGSSNIIRINPVLDKKNVPDYFISFVIYHEMLHEVLGEGLQGGRRRLHSKEFKNKEKLFNDYERATEWERKFYSNVIVPKHPGR